MSVGIGSKSRVAYIEETAYGAFPVTPAGVELGILSETFEQTINTFVSDEIRSDRQVPSVRGGNKMAEGDVNVELSPNALGLFFKHLLTCTPVSALVVPTAGVNGATVARGAYISSGTDVYLVTRPGTLDAAFVTSGAPVSTDPNEEETNGTATLQFAAADSATIYEHVFTANTVRPTGGIAMEKMISLGATAQYFRFTGGRVNNFNLTVPQEGIVTGSMSFLFKKLLDIDSATIFTGGLTSPADEPFAGSGSIVQLFAPGAPGTPINDQTVNSFSLSVTNNFDGNVYALGERFRKDLVEQRREITGSMDVWFESLTEYNYFNNESEIGIAATFNHLGQYMSFALGQVKLTGGSPTPKISGQGVVNTSYNFQAFKGTGQDIVLKIYNTTVSY